MLFRNLIRKTKDLEGIIMEIVKIVVLNNECF